MSLSQNARFLWRDWGDPTLAVSMSHFTCPAVVDKIEHVGITNWVTTFLEGLGDFTLALFTSHFTCPGVVHKIGQVRRDLLVP
jgi:hypothetical protein